MPRGRKKIVVEKNYDKLIAEVNASIHESQSKIEFEKQSIADKKKELKQLIKDKAAFEKQKALKEKEEWVKKLAEEIEASGKTFEEVEAFVRGTNVKADERETDTETDK